MKKAVVVVVAVGMFCGFWFFQAGQIQKAVQSQFPALTYDAVERSGFPLGLQLTFVNPKMKNEDFDARVVGNLHSDWSIFGRLKEVSTNGTVQVVSPYAFEVTGNSKIALEDMSFSKGELSLEDTKIALCAQGIPGSYGIDALTVQYAVDAGQADRLKLALDVSGKGLQETSFANSLRPFAADCKQDIAFAVECDMPTLATIQQIEANPMLALIGKVPSCSISVTKFDGTSKFQAANMSGSLNIEEDDDNNVVLSLSGLGNSQYFEGINELCLARIDYLKQESDRGTFDASESKVLKALTSNSDLMKGLIPNLEKLGKVHFVNEMRIVWNKRTQNWNVAIDELGFSCDQYSAFLKLYAQADEPTPRVDAHLTLKNAQPLVDDAMKFYNNFVKLIDDEAMPIDPSKAKAIYAILQNFATVNADNTLQIAFECKDNEMSIGDKTFERAIADAYILWNDIEECQASVCQ